MKKPKLSNEAKGYLDEWWKLTQVQLNHDIEQLHQFGGHSLANRKQSILDELTELVKYLEL